MMHILATGALNTVQDQGRHGYRKFGVGVAGAVDALAAAVGNTMLGNPRDAAFVEVLLFPFRVRFTADTRIALTGADARATLDDKALLPWWSLPVRAGQVLSLQSPRQGGVAYLCVAGGIDVPPVLGSRSTDLKAHFGGLAGRPLAKGDTLAVCAVPDGGRAPRRASGFGVVPPAVALPQQEGPSSDATCVRVLPAAEWGAFSEAVRRTFLSTDWTVSPNSNRIGLRLEGPVLQPRHKRELLSHGIVPGVIQVPPAGLPIVMQCDAQTSGGYPKMATVIEADQWRVAQTRLGGRLRFAAVDLAQAQAAWQAQQRYLQRIQRAADLAA